MEQAKIMKEFHYEHLQFKDATSPFIFHRGCLVDKTHPFPAHWHESIEILYFYEGEGEVVIDTQRIPVVPGDIVCINSEKIHYISTDTATMYNTLIIPPAFLEKCGIYSDHILTSHIPDRLERNTAKLYRVITTENKNKKAYYQSAQKAAITTLIIHLYRNYSTPNYEKNAITGAAKSQLVKKSLDYIHLNYLENISTTDISNKLGITVNHLCACFKDVTGLTIKKYINGMRCHDAEAMLASGQYTVMEVGTKCGFDNMAYFAKTYRSIIGVNPSATLAQAKENTDLAKGRLNRIRKAKLKNNL